jgi:hypothetical protein
MNESQKNIILTRHRISLAAQQMRDLDVQYMEYMIKAFRNEEVPPDLQEAVARRQELSSLIESLRSDLSRYEGEQ